MDGAIMPKRKELRYLSSYKVYVSEDGTLYIRMASGSIYKVDKMHKFRR